MKALLALEDGFTLEGESFTGPIELTGGEVIFNTASGKRTTHDSRAIRQTTLHYGVSFTTTISGARAIARAIQHQQNKALNVECLQDYYAGSPKGERA